MGRFFWLRPLAPLLLCYVASRGQQPLRGRHLRRGPLPKVAVFERPQWGGARTVARARARVPRGFPAEERKCSDRKSHNPGSMSERARLPESGCLSPATVEWRARALIVFNYIFHSPCFVRWFIFFRCRRSGVHLYIKFAFSQILRASVSTSLIARVDRTDKNGLSCPDRRKGRSQPSPPRPGGNIFETKHIMKPQRILLKPQ